MDNKEKNSQQTERTYRTHKTKKKKSSTLKNCYTIVPQKKKKK